MADDDLKRHQGAGPHAGPDRSSPYPVSRLTPPIDLVDVARQIEQADQMVSARVGSKLRVIADQIRSLQEEARSVLAEAKQDQDLHHVRCNFQKKPGQIYHLYEKDDHSRCFSLLSPDDWGGKPPHRFIGSYRLEADMSWTPAEEIGRPDDTNTLIRRLLDDQGL